MEKIIDRLLSIIQIIGKFYHLLLMNKVQITIQALTKRDGPTYTTITNRK